MVGRGQGRPAETRGRFLNGFLAGFPFLLEDGLDAREAALGMVTMSLAEAASLEPAPSRGGTGPKSGGSPLQDVWNGRSLLPRVR